MSFFDLFLILVTVAITVPISTRVDFIKKHPMLISAIFAIAAIAVAILIWPPLKAAVAEFFLELAGIFQ